MRASLMGKEVLERKFTQDKIPFNSEALQDIAYYFHLQNITDLYYQIAAEKIDKTKLNIAEILEQVKRQRAERTQEVKKEKEEQAAKKASGSYTKDAVILGDEVEMPYTFAKCCNPIPGDEIFGFITVGEGVKIHRNKCPNAIGLMSNYGYRLIKAKWANHTQSEKAFTTSIKVEGIDSVGIVSTIADIISKQLQINMHSIQISSKAGMFEGLIELEVYDTLQLEELMNKIKASSPLIKVSREDVGR